MKSVRYIFGATICLFALYGGYEFIVQNTANDKSSDVVIQELRDSGFDIGTGDAKDAVSAMLQSDLGTPTASFGMATGSSPQQTVPSVVTPDSASQMPVFSGLPPSLRNSDAAVTVVTPEPQPFLNPPSSPQTIIPSFQMQTPIDEPEKQFSPQQTDFDNSTIHTTQCFQPTLDFPVFVNVGSAPEVSSPQAFNTPPETSSSEQATAETAVMNGILHVDYPNQPLIQPPPAQIPTPLPAPQPDPEPIQISGPASAQSAPPVSWPSAYTFNVVMPPTDEINTTGLPPEQPQVDLTPTFPGEPPHEPPYQQQLTTFQPVVAAATSPQVQPLPPVRDDATTTLISPPVFIPNIRVTSLPPVEDEGFATETSVPMMTLATPFVADPPQPSPQLYNPPESYILAESPNCSVIPAMPTDAMTVPFREQKPVQQIMTAQTQVPPTDVPPVFQPAIQPAVQPAILSEPQNPQQPIMHANVVTPLPQSQEVGVDPAVIDKVAKIGELLTHDQVPAAYEQLSRIYFYDEMTNEERQYVAKHLDQLAGGVLFSRRHHILEPAYVVKEGDTVESVATQNKITPELLRKLNGIPNGENVVAGAELKVLRGPLDAKIFPSYHEMVILMRGNYACRFPISVGSGYAGQEGSFTVQGKDVNRSYQLAPGMDVIPPGDPANPLGSRWIELSKEMGTIGVHGTNNPAQIGTTRQSAGCFGLREQDIAEVYDMLTIGSKVTIVR